jgi:hypothetical protein
LHSKSLADTLRSIPSQWDELLSERRWLLAAVVAAAANERFDPNPSWLTSMMIGGRPNLRNRLLFCHGSLWLGKEGLQL